MAGKQELWGKEKIEKYAKAMEKESKWVYAPFARKIVKNLKPVERGLVIIDLSTGPGFLSVELNKLLPDARIIGVDPSIEMLQIAKENAEKVGMSNYETKLGKAERIPLESNGADLVVNQYSLHEWGNPKQGFLEILRVLKPGGRLILKDLNKDCPKWKLQLFGLLIAIKSGRQSAKDHLSSYNIAFGLSEVIDLLREAGFDKIKGEGKGLELFVQALKSYG